MKLSKLGMLDFYKINIIRNTIQYSLGAGFYFILNNSFSPFIFIVGLIGFLIAYQSVYFFNDVMDYDSDKKDEMRSKIKMLIKGKIKINTAISLAFFFAILGLLISFSIGQFFGIMVFLCLFLNFLHSSNLLRLKTTKLLLPNLFLIEYIKYSLGWFVFSSGMRNFPFFIIACASAVYITAYVYYKNNIKEDLFKDKRIKFLSAISLSLYIISVFVYPFKLPLIIFLLFPVAALSLRRINNLFIKIKVGNLIFFIIIISFIISIFSLTVPSIAQINENISAGIDSIKENISRDMPEGLNLSINSINKTISDDINNNHILNSLLNGRDIFDLK